jgi:hypothetical protein
MAIRMLNDLADEIDAARKEWLDCYHDLIPREKAKQRLLQLLWDDKSTIILALRAAGATEVTLTNGTADQ